MRLSDLPNVEFFNTDKEHVQQKVFDIYTTITGRTLGEGDPVTLFLNVISEIIIRLLNDANYAAKQNLLAYAEGDNLDHVGAVPAAVERLRATKATTTIQATLSAVRTNSVIIPKGTKISTAGGEYFVTVENLVILPGQLNGSVKAEAQRTGAQGNGFKPGEISTIIDPIAFVDTMSNTTLSEGGSDTEDDVFMRLLNHSPWQALKVPMSILQNLHHTSWPM